VERQVPPTRPEFATSDAFPDAFPAEAVPRDRLAHPDAWARGPASVLPVPDVPGPGKSVFPELDWQEASSALPDGAKEEVRQMPGSAVAVAKVWLLNRAVEELPAVVRVGLPGDDCRKAPLMESGGELPRPHWDAAQSAPLAGGRPAVK
jgi:hypothetical protein